MKDNSIKMLFQNLLNKRLNNLEKKNELNLKELDTFNKDVSKLDSIKNI